MIFLKANSHWSLSWSRWGQSAHSQHTSLWSTV